MERRETLVGGSHVSWLRKGSGEPVLYLHGFPTAGYLWRKVIEVVSSEFSCVAPDLPGFGRSPLLEAPHTWRNLVDWCDAFVDTLGIAPVHLAVHDWGGLIGLPWFCEHPEKVRTLFITDTSFRSADRRHVLAEEWRRPRDGRGLSRKPRSGRFALGPGRAAHSVPSDAVKNRGWVRQLRDAKVAPLQAGTSFKRRR